MVTTNLLAIDEGIRVMQQRQRWNGGDVMKSVGFW